MSVEALYPSPQAFDPALTAATFTIALSDVGELAFLLRLLKAFRSQAPYCAIRSVAVPPAQLAHQLEEGEIDLAVGYYPTLSPRTFRQRRVETQRFACLMRAAHPARGNRLTAKEFSALEHMVVRAEGRSQELLERFLERRRIRRNIVLLTPHFVSWHRRFDNEPRSRWLREQFAHSYGAES